MNHRCPPRLQMVSVIFAAGLLAAAVSGMAWAEDAPPATEEVAPAAGFTKIVLSDSGGFTGRGTGKWLSIDGDGKVQLKNRKGGDIHGQLSQQELADLARDVAAIDWSKVEKHYLSRGADMIQNDLMVTIGGKTHGTHAVKGAVKLPAAVQTLMARLGGLYRQFATAEKK